MPSTLLSLADARATRRSLAALGRVTWLLSGAAFGCVGGATCGLAAPQVAPRSAPPQHLTVVATPGTRVQATPDSAEYDFGSVSGVSQALIVHVFLLRNDGKKPLTLDHLQSSCGCTSATLLPVPSPSPLASAGPIVFAPHQQAQVQVTVDPTIVTPGDLHKTVWVFVRGQAAPAATLIMTGELLPVAAFAPPVVDFGSVSAGTRLTQLLKVTLDPALLPPGATWSLVSSDPDVQVRPTPDGAATAAVLTVPAPAGPLAPDAQSAPAIPPPPAARTFQVTLTPQAHLGMVRGSVSVAFSIPAAPPVSGDSLPIMGEVTGDIVASPPVISLGVVPAGQEARRQTIVMGKVSQALAVSSPSPYLTARLERQPVTVGGRTATAGGNEVTLLTVVLSPQAPTGPLQTQAVVTTPGGERLLVPIYGNVKAAAPGVPTRTAEPPHP